MRMIIKNLPNMITLLRIMLSCLLNIYIIKNFGNITIPIIITMIIFLTDFADGKAARYYGSFTKFGAVFDVAADLFYITASYLTLYFYRVLPIWFLFIILYKFLEFIVTSHFIKRQNSIKTSFVFDPIGRLVAVIFYVIPILSYISYHVAQSIYSFTINKLFYVILVFALTSTSSRLWSCAKIIRIPLQQKYSLKCINLQKTLIKILTLQK